MEKVKTHYVATKDGTIIKVKELENEIYVAKFDYGYSVISKEIFSEMEIDFKNLI